MHLMIKFSLTILLLNFLTACGVSSTVEACHNPHPSQKESCDTADPVWNKMDWDKSTWG